MRIESKQKLYAAIVFIVMLVMSLLFIFDYSFSKFASFTTVFSFLFIFYLYINISYPKEFNQTKKECEEKKYVLQILYDEMSSALNDLNSDKESIDIYLAPLESVKITYANKFFNTDMYGSLKFSDKLSLFDYELRQKIQNIFQKLKYHDKYLDRINIIEDELVFNNSKIFGSVYDLSPKNIHFDASERYYYLLHDCEQSLLEEIPDILEKLEKRINTL